MSKIELYLVKSSSGSYDDYRESNEPIVYATKEAAEKRKQEVIDAHKIEPFPLDWCTEKEYYGLRWSNDEADNIKADKYRDIVDEWDSNNYDAKEFNDAWVEPVQLDLQSWREKQLKDII
jgi:hypothetical protein